MIVKERHRKLYSVWNNYTDELVVLDGNAKRAAEAMGVKMITFYSTVTHSKQGRVKKWHIEVTKC